MKKNILPTYLSEREYRDMFKVMLTESGASLTASEINNVLSDAYVGNSQEQTRLFKIILERDAVMAAHMQTRMLGVLGLHWSITGGNNPEKRNTVKRLLEEAGIYYLMQHLMQAVPFGYSAAFIDWRKAGGEIRDFKFIDPENVVFDDDSVAYFVFPDGTRKCFGEYNPNQIVFHTHNSRSGIPSSKGLARTLIWVYFYKIFALKHRARFLEKYGIPFLITKITDTDFADEQKRKQIKEQLRAIGADGVGVITTQTEVNTLQINEGGQNANFGEYIKYFDDVIALVCLGQLASASQGTGFSNGQIQENVRRDLLKADAIALQNTIQNQIIRRFEWFKYGTNELSFTFEIETPENLKNKSDMIAVLNQLGFKPQRKWVEEVFGVPLQEEKTDAGLGNILSGLTGPEPKSISEPSLPMELPEVPELNKIQQENKIEQPTGE